MKQKAQPVSALDFFGYPIFLADQMTARLISIKDL
jgi:hypothetical protein